MEKLLGSLCLCWQEIPCLDAAPHWAYSIAILDKDIVIRHRYQVSVFMILCV